MKEITDALELEVVKILNNKNITVRIVEHILRTIWNI